MLQKSEFAALKPGINSCIIAMQTNEGSGSSNPKQEQASLTVPGIYKRLFAGDTVTIPGITKNRYENIRTHLVKLHRPNVLLELSDDSVCARWDKETNTGKFWLGTPQQKQGSKLQVFIESTPNEPDADSEESAAASATSGTEDAGEIRADLGRAEESSDRSQSVGSSERAERSDDSDNHQHGSANEEPSADY